MNIAIKVINHKETEQEMKELQNNQRAINKMAISIKLPIISLTINGLNSLKKVK